MNEIYERHMSKHEKTEFKLYQIRKERLIKEEMEYKELKERYYERVGPEEKV